MFYFEPFLGVFSCVLGHYPVGGPTTCDWDTGQHISLQNASTVLSFHCTQIQDTLCQMEQSNTQNLTEPPPCFPAAPVFFSFYASFLHLRADVTCQTAPVLSHLSKGHSPRSFVAFFQFAFLLFYNLLSTVVSSIKSTLAYLRINNWFITSLTLSFFGKKISFTFGIVGRIGCSTDQLLGPNYR